MQLSLFNDLHALEQEGFAIEKTFKPSGDDRLKSLESMYSVFLNENIILYVQDNEDGTYNTFGYNHEGYSVDLQEVLEILKNKNNWCLILESESNE